jgi:PKD repeat protein
MGPAFASTSRVVYVVLACAVLAASALAASASASETTIGFDGLAAGELVGNQYEAQGLKLGKATEFGQKALTAGDCGLPTVREEPAPGIAFSSPNYAVLENCGPDPAGPHTSSDTYGKLLGGPRGSVSVEVRDLTVSPSFPKVTLMGYDSGGVQVASAEGEARQGTWTRLAITPAGGAKTIVYFSIVVSNPDEDQVAIDDIRYEGLEGAGGEKEKPGEEKPEEKPGEKPSGGNPGGGSPLGGPPIAPIAAAVSLQTPSPYSGEPITLSGAGSQPGAGRVISYAWDLNGDGRVDTSTGTNPNVHLILPPGVHNIGLTVTNSNKESSNTRFGLNVSNVLVTTPPKDGGEGECKKTFEVGSAQLVAECIQTLPGKGGYVIASKQVALNGMDLVPVGGGFGVFKIHEVRHLGLSTEVQLSGSAVEVELLNTPIGDVVLGGRDLESEPMTLQFEAFHSKTTIKAITGSTRRSAHTAGAPSKTLLMALAVGHECSSGEKKASCCPPKNQLAACATLPGGFPLTGQIQVFLSKKGQALFDGQVNLDLKSVNFEATGAIEIHANLETGIELNSLKFEIGEASLAPIFKVKKASFTYYFPEYEEESKRDSWQAKGTITFGEEIAELEAELAFKKGEFQSASMKFKAEPGVPIYPGINLNEIGASVGVNPLAFGGSLGAKIAALLELEFAFAFREATSTELGFFGGEGKLSYKDDDIATLAADVYTDGYVDAQVTFNLHFPFDSKEPVIEVSGGAGFWDEPSSGLWQAKGNVYFKLWIISAEVAGLINNQYAAGCLHVGAEGIFGGGVQGRYRFSDGNIDGGLFGNDNCSDQLKQYSQKALVKHSGGFVKEEAARFLAKPGELWRGMAPLATVSAASEEDTFTLASGGLGQELRITSSTGTPVVTLVGPGGQTYTTPATSGQLAMVGGQFMSAIGPAPHQVLVLLRKPKAGIWRLQPAPGSPPVAKLEVSEDVAPAAVTVHVSRRHGHRWGLAYKVSHYLPGTKVRFVERGRDSTHVLGLAGKAKGALTFTPQEGLSRGRTVYAYLLNSEGAVVRELTVGRFTAPPAFEPGRARKVKIVRRGASAAVTWSAVPGVRAYRVRVRGSDGRLQSFFRKASRRSVSISNVLPFESFTVSVVAVGPNMLRGGAATGRLAPVKAKRPKPKKHPGKGKG